MFDNGYYSGAQTGELIRPRTTPREKCKKIEICLSRHRWVVNPRIRWDLAGRSLSRRAHPAPARRPEESARLSAVVGCHQRPDAPPLPPNSGSGKRLVYDRAGQRVWAVSKDEVVIRSWLIAGSKYSNETPGTHEVYSRSDVSTAWNGKAWLPKMVRWLKTDIGAIGFHAIPLHVNDNSPYQTEAELGQRLSGGCQRQANRDADFTWDFAKSDNRRRYLDLDTALTGRGWAHHCHIASWLNSQSMTSSPPSSV